MTPQAKTKNPANRKVPRAAETNTKAANEPIDLTQRKNTVLVTGAAGALAQQVINRLRDHCNIVAVDFRQITYLSDDIPSYKVDFNKRVFEDLFRKFDFDSVIHLGRIASTEGTRLSRYTANVLGSQKLFDLCHKYGINHVIVLSTFHVYGASAYNPALIDESAPLKAAELTMDLVDSVELENLANIYLWRFPDLNITILRACNIVGPGVKNTMSRLLSSKVAPTMAGFSPMMQFIHLDDMADAIVLAHAKSRRGVYNVAPRDWIAYQDALDLCGCIKIPLPSIPPILPRLITQLAGLKMFPSFLVNYFKYPVIIDGTSFEQTFGFKAKRPLKEIFRAYREMKD